MGRGNGRVHGLMGAIKSAIFGGRSFCSSDYLRLTTHLRFCTRVQLSDFTFMSYCNKSMIYVFLWDRLDAVFLF